MIRLYKIRDYNFILVLLLAVISTMGILLVGSADAELQLRQIMGVLLGFGVMVFLSLIDYSWILNMYYYIYAVMLFLLALVLLVGVMTNGAARWVNIGGFQFQPTELCKILMIMFLAAWFMKHERNISSFSTIAQAVILAGIPLVMILRQPDLKNTITMTIIFSLMYFAAGLEYKKIGIILLIIIPVVLILFLLITQTNLPIVDDYQKERIMTFMEPNNEEYSESAMQQENSIMAIGSGQLTGKGLNNNSVSSANKGNFIAEIQNDFIFAVAGEELGFAGCFFIILLLFMIVLQCFITGKNAKDMSGTLVCYGVGSLIAVQSFINISVATGMLPNTGTTLPFVSYGLTSIVSLYIGMGMVLNIGLQKKQYYEMDRLYIGTPAEGYKETY